MKYFLLLLGAFCFLPSWGSASDEFCKVFVLNNEMLSQEEQNNGNHFGACRDIVDCKLVKRKPNFGYCATNTAFEERELKPGEQICCTATEVVVKKVPEDKLLVCSASQWYLADKLVPGKPNVRKHWCCTNDGCKTNEFNAYATVAYFCTATDAFAIVGKDQDIVACTNNACYEPFSSNKYKLVCKQFMPPRY
jgi:hypothetical protein